MNGYTLIFLVMALLAGVCFSASVFFAYRLLSLKSFNPPRSLLLSSVFIIPFWMLLIIFVSTVYEPWKPFFVLQLHLTILQASIIFSLLFTLIQYKVLSLLQK